jgi:hypothetical protein
MRVSIHLGSKRVAAAAAFTAAAAMAAPAMAAGDAVYNGGFEIGANGPMPGVGNVVDGWNVFQATTVQDTTFPHSGLADLFFNNSSPASNSYAYQDTPIGSVMAGSTYTFSFYAAGNFAVGGIAQYALTFEDASHDGLGGSGVQTIFPGATYSQFPSAGNNTFVAPANASFAEIQFFAVTGGATGSTAQLYLDDVSLTAPSTVAGGATAWNVATSGDWNVASNWTAGVPNAPGAEADFLGAITAPHTVYTDIPVTVGILNFNNTNQYVISGAGSLTMQTSTGSANIIVQAGTQKIDLPLTIASNTSINVSSGATLLVSNPVTINSGVAVTTVPSGGTVSYQSYVTLGTGASLALAGSTKAFSLNLGSGASTTVPVSTGTRSLLQTNSLSLATGSTLNLNNNDLIVHGGSVAAVSAALAAGYNHGNWTGAGITSGVAASNSNHLTALGVMPAAAAGTYDNTAVAAGDVLVRYTYYGDANLDGKVDGSDYSLIDAAYAADKKTPGSVTGWYNGDFNYDGVIDGTDYALIDNAFNNQGGAITAGSAVQVAAVPEPAALGLLGAGALSLMFRRRTNRLAV